MSKSQQAEPQVASTVPQNQLNVKQADKEGLKTLPPTTTFPFESGGFMPPETPLSKNAMALGKNPPKDKFTDTVQMLKAFRRPNPLTDDVKSSEPEDPEAEADWKEKNRDAGKEILAGFNVFKQAHGESPAGGSNTSTAPVQKAPDPNAPAKVPGEGKEQLPPQDEEKSFHDEVKKYSGKNSIKLSMKKIPYKGFDIEGSFVLALLTGKTKKTESGISGPKAKWTPELQSQLDANKGALYGVIKTGALDVVSGNAHVMSTGEFGEIYGGFRLYVDGPEVKGNEDKVDYKFGSAKIQFIGRWEREGVTFDVYFEGSISAGSALAKEMLKKRLEKKAAEKIAKGKALQQATLKALEAEKALLKNQLKLLQGSKSMTKTELLNFLNSANQKSLQQLDGIGPKKAAEIIAERKKGGFTSLDDVKRVKGIKDATLKKIKGTTFVQKNASQIAKLKGRLGAVTDDIAKVSAKGAVDVFEKEAAKKAGKRTVAKVASKVAAKLGLKVAAKIVLRFIPFVNIAMIAWDLYDIGMLIYNNYEGKGDGQGGNDGENVSAEEKNTEGENTTVSNGVGVSKETFEKLNSAPANVKKIWDSLFKKSETGNVSDSDIERFLDIVPKDISTEQTENVIAAILEEKTSSVAELLTKLEKTITEISEKRNEDIAIDDNIKGKDEKKEKEKAKGPAGGKEGTDEVWEGEHRHYEAKDVAFEGEAGEGRAGTVGVVGALSNHYKGEVVNITLVGTNFSKDTVSVYNVPALVTKRLFFSGNTLVRSASEADHMRIYYTIQQGVKFNFPGKDGVLSSGKEVIGMLTLKR